MKYIFSNEEWYPWAAGFFDGEGSISICKTKQKRATARPYYTLKIIVTQLDAKSLEHFRSIFGMEDTPIQRVYGRGKQKDYHRLTFSGPYAAYALTKMLPYMRVKGQLAKIGLALQTHIESIPFKVRRQGLTAEMLAYRESLYQELKALQPKRRFRAAVETERKSILVIEDDATVRASNEN